MRNKRWYYIVLIFCFPVLLQAQDIQVSSSLDRDTMKIGEQALLSLKVMLTDTTHIRFPEIGDTLSASVEVVEVSGIDTLHTKAGRLLEQKVHITVFDSGHYAIPKFRFLAGKGDKYDTLFSNDLILHIMDVPVDTSQAINDIKDLLIVPAPPGDYSWLWWSLLLIPLAGAVYYLLKRPKRQKAEVVVAEPALPPHIKALQALDKIEQEKIWQKGQHKLYHSRVADAVRTYIEERYKVQALERTSNEILSLLSGMVSKDVHEQLSQVLKLADMVKFARFNPIPAENELSMQHARNIIKSTTIKEQQDLQA